VNEQQRTAIENHCRLASETIHPRYRRVEALYSVIVTVNSGYE
jgi:hypothetical protein